MKQAGFWPGLFLEMAELLPATTQCAIQGDFTA